jgi:hypothetical protein
LNIAGVAKEIRAFLGADRPDNTSDPARLELCQAACVISGGCGTSRRENILFWPVVAALTLTLVFRNWARIDRRFFHSLPIMSPIAYLVFAAASVTWAYAPDFAFSRLLVQVLAVIVVAVPYALPIATKYTIPGVHLCFAIALAISAVYVLTTPPSRGASP